MSVSKKFKFSELTEEEYDRIMAERERKEAELIAKEAELIAERTQLIAERTERERKEAELIAKEAELNAEKAERARKEAEFNAEIAKIRIKAVLDAEAQFKQKLKDYSKSAKSFKDNILPGIKMVLTSDALTSTTQRHQEINATASTFSILDDVDERTIHAPSYMIALSQRPNYVAQIANESDVSFYIRLVLEDVIACILNHSISIHTEVSIFSHRPDIMVLNSFKIPFFICEVKKPHKDVDAPSILLNKHVQGQMFDYLQSIKSYSGQKYSIGVLSTFAEWRLAWLQEDNEFAQCSNIKDFLSSSTTTTTTSSSSSSSSQTMYATEIFSFNHPNLFNILSSVIIKCMESPLHHVELINYARKYSYLNSHDCLWKVLPRSITYTSLNYNFDQLVSCDFENNGIFILKSIGRGSQGRSYLVCTNASITFAVKMYISSSNDENTRNADTEALMWNRLWNIDTKVSQLFESVCICMPYLQVVNYRDDPTIHAMVVQQIHHVAQLGYCLTDLKEEHVGLYNNTIMFCDLLNYYEFDKSDQHAINEAIRKMKEQLQIIN